MLHSAQAKHKYTEMAVKIREYEVKKYEIWLAETECNLPLLLKKNLLVSVNCEKQVHAELVSIFSLIFLLKIYTQYCEKFI